MCVCENAFRSVVDLLSSREEVLHSGFTNERLDITTE